MGKIKPVIMGDIEAEEAARKKAEAKRAQKKAERAKQKAAEEKTPNQNADTQKTALKTESVALPSEEKTTHQIKEKGKKTESNKVGKRPRGQKYLASAKLVDKNKKYPLFEALELAQKTSFSQFDGSIEAVFNVTEKGLRGIVTLPHGTGKQIRVKIADEALIDYLEKGGAIDFDILVAHPSLMPKLARVAKILGPKGLMPNPKTNTISENPAQLAETLSQGQVNWKTESNFPIIHAVIGKVSFETKKLEENLTALIKAIGKERIVSCFVKATMGPSVKVQIT